MKFQTVIELGGKTATGFQVPEEVVAALGAGKRPPVRVTISGHTYRSTIAPYTGAYYLPLAAEHREAAGVAAGETVEVEVELDTEPRVVEVPPDLKAALAADDEARGFFEGLSYSNQRRLVLSIEDAKTDETRRRRIEKTIAKLREKKT
jgi:hypothetical protein